MQSIISETLYKIHIRWEFPLFVYSFKNVSVVFVDTTNFAGGVCQPRFMSGFVWWRSICASSYICGCSMRLLVSAQSVPPCSLRSCWSDQNRWFSSVSGFSYLSRTCQGLPVYLFVVELYSFSLSTLSSSFPFSLCFVDLYLSNRCSWALTSWLSFRCFLSVSAVDYAPLVFWVLSLPCSSFSLHTMADSSGLLSAIPTELFPLAHSHVGEHIDKYAGYLKMTPVCVIAQFRTASSCLPFGLWH